MRNLGILTDEERADFVRRLDALASNDDVEVAHVNADNILVEILTHLGEEEIVTAYEAVPKWYA